MADNYRDYVDKLLAGVRWTAGVWGERLTRGFFALFADLIAEGARQSNQARLTIQSNADALGEIGLTRDVERYFADTEAQYRGRLARAFSLHAEDGTKQAVEKSLAEYGYPGATVYEDFQWHRAPQPWWSQGWILFPAGSHTVTIGSQVYGGGGTYGGGTLYGVAGITVGEVNGLIRLVHRRKRAAFIFRELIFENGTGTYGTGLVYGGGVLYGVATSQVLIGAV